MGTVEQTRFAKLIEEEHEEEKLDGKLHCTDPCVRVVITTTPLAGIISSRRAHCRA